MDFTKKISLELNISEQQAGKTIILLNEGGTVPFIARYRKEHTGGLDEILILKIRDLYEKEGIFQKRKLAILDAINDSGKLDELIRNNIESAANIIELEDLYLPFKVKRKTKAARARENGLEPLAILFLEGFSGQVEKVAARYLTENVSSPSEALEGARDIIAELINENRATRDRVRSLFERNAIIQSEVLKSKKEEATQYKDYFNYTEKAERAPSHRLLAILRGEEEGMLRVTIRPEEKFVLEIIEKQFIKINNEASMQVSLAIKDCYKRLLGPSIENEFRKSLKEKADKEAIIVFAENLKQLLLAAPLGEKRILAIDPGFRSGCKVVCLDALGDLLYNETIFPNAPQSQVKQASAKISQLVETYSIEVIAIGNGTAGRETENFIKRLKFNKDVKVYVVNEQGASIYSASPAAREEFPQFDITVRGAVSIGRRLMDPLAELVKIDPKSIGVGQYQHDVDQTELKKSLNDTVELSVNRVGVNLNTAGKHLLSYVSGIGPVLAQKIVDYKKKNGPFRSRKDLLKVPGLGVKVFEQCAGFLRIRESENPLDNSGIHPERYKLVEKMAKDINCKLEELIKNQETREKIQPEKYINAETSSETLKDILVELSKPGLDPRKKLKVFEFEKGITKPEHLKVGMSLPGIITNITNFGAFVDIGVKQDGLVHISNLCNEFVSNPADVVKLNQFVRVKVIEIDIPRKRIGLSMKGEEVT